MDIGQGEVDWDTFFATLNRLGFADGADNVMTSCVFAREERARESATFMRETIGKYVGSW